MVGGSLSVADHDAAEERFCLEAPPGAFVGCTHADCQSAAKSGKCSRGQRLAHQYGSRVKMNVVPVTIGALAPTKDTLTSLT